MRYHQFEEAPSHLVAEVRAQRRYESRLSHHPDCRDPEHPGCRQCEPEAFAEPVPEGHMTLEQFIQQYKQQLDTFAEQHQGDESLRCEAGWSELLIDWLVAS